MKMPLLRAIIGQSPMLLMVGVKAGFRVKRGKGYAENNPPYTQKTSKTQPVLGEERFLWNEPPKAQKNKKKGTPFFNNLV